MSNLETISAQIADLSDADRKALLAKVSAAAIHPEMHLRIKRALNGLAPAENHDRIIDRLASEGAVRTYMPGEYHASAASADDLRKSRLDRLSAAKENPTTRSNVVLLEGLLKRGGVTLDAVLDGDLAKIDAVFAASRLTVSDRLAAKSLLHTYGCL
jgi:hypothetical protein